MQNAEYVEQAGGAFRLVGTRIGLESVVYGYLNGQSAESIQDDFPSLSLEAIHGAIAYYLHNQAEVDRYLGRLANRMDEVRRKSETENSALLARLREERRRTPAN
jgi:uncharacterized protein (DUF433 family)